MSTSEKLKCASCNGYLCDTPVQCSCGDRLCGRCFTKVSRIGTSFECLKCAATVNISECFKDRAVLAELRKATISCENQGCSWTGSVDEYLGHSKTCQHSVARLSEESPDCEEKFTSRKKRFNMANQSCSETEVNVAENKESKKEYSVDEECAVTRRQLLLLKEKMEDQLTLQAQQISDLRSEINHVLREISVQIHPVATALGKAETAIQNLQEGFSELALMVQTLQATSYNGTFIWKIPEVQRRRHEAKIGKTISLYSAPFYTSRQGYKACLRLYMDGDGCGKNTHLSFFVTIMKGEYDALLQWPFRHTVTLTLLDQEGVKNISQAFQPEPTSSSFQRPRNEMNIASGCPMFAPLSVLNNSSYVKEDTMFLKCEIGSSTY